MSINLKLGIFIGSTRRDLFEARDAVIKAVIMAGHIPSGMELWAAGHIPTLDAIERHLNICDIHTLILGTRYGSTVKGGLSFTEWEYRQSLGQGRPIIAFLLESEAFEEAIEKRQKETINLSPRKQRQLKEEVERLRKFRKELESRALCRFFTEDNFKSIGTDCVNSINEAINSGNLKDSAGWIHSSSERGRRLREIERNRFLQSILDRIYRFSTLTKRLEKEPAAKKILAEIFWKVMFGRIKRCGYHNLFFESGSTLAFVADEFERKLRQSEGGSSENSNWKITTNNAITLLQLLLYTHLDVSPKPASWSN